MEFKKERNFIVAYDGGNKRGAWDIQTRNFLGVKGGIVKNVPACFTYSILRETFNGTDETEDTSALYAHAIYMARESCLIDADYHGIVAENFESLISVGLLPSSLRVLRTQRVKLNKDIIEYLKEHYHGEYTEEAIAEYEVRRVAGDFLTDKPQYIADTYLRCYKNTHIPKDYLKTVLNRMYLEHVDAFYQNHWNLSDELANIIRNFYSMCMTLYGTVKVSPNFLSNYAQIAHLYNEYKAKNYNNLLKKNNDHDFLHFQNDQYIAFPLLTRESFHEEAEAQGNCVERCYMEKVVDNSTYIVVVRDISTPNKSLITCEVDKTGKIVQYLGRFNGRVTVESQKAFKTEYQAYILKHIFE